MHQCQHQDKLTRFLVSLYSDYRLLIWNVGVYFAFGSYVICILRLQFFLFDGRSFPDVMFCQCVMSIFCLLLWQAYAVTQPYASQAAQSQQMPYVTPTPAPYNPNFAFHPAQASGFAAADNRYSSGLLLPGSILMVTPWFFLHLFHNRPLEISSRGLWAVAVVVVNC